MNWLFHVILRWLCSVQLLLLSPAMPHQWWLGFQDLILFHHRGLSRFMTRILLSDRSILLLFLRSISRLSLQLLRNLKIQLPHFIPRLLNILFLSRHSEPRRRLRLRNLFSIPTRVRIALGQLLLNILLDIRPRRTSFLLDAQFCVLLDIAYFEHPFLRFFTCLFLDWFSVRSILWCSCIFAEVAVSSLLGGVFEVRAFA